MSCLATVYARKNWLVYQTCYNKSCNSNSSNSWKIKVITKSRRCHWNKPGTLFAMSCALQSKGLSGLHQNREVVVTWSETLVEKCCWFTGPRSKKCWKKLSAASAVWIPQRERERERERERFAVEKGICSLNAQSSCDWDGHDYSEHERKKHVLRKTRVRYKIAGLIKSSNAWNKRVAGECVV